MMVTAEGCCQRSWVVMGLQWLTALVVAAKQGAARELGEVEHEIRALSMR